MIPLKYNLRNLRVRWATTALTVVGTGMIVWSSCILFSLVEGLQQLPNVVISPHTAFYTDHALRDTVEASIANCLAFLDGKQSWIG